MFTYQEAASALKRAHNPLSTRHARVLPYFAKHCKIWPSTSLSRLANSAPAGTGPSISKCCAISSLVDEVRKRRSSTDVEGPRDSARMAAMSFFDSSRESSEARDHTQTSPSNIIDRLGKNDFNEKSNRSKATYENVGEVPVIMSAAFHCNRLNAQYASLILPGNLMKHMIKHKLVKFDTLPIGMLEEKNDFNET